MEKSRSSMRVRFQESGGGWGNPLMGLVFDSDQDVPAEKQRELQELLDHCDLKESGDLPGEPPADATTFQLQVELPDKAVTLVGDMVRADEKLRKLVSFIRDHCRKGMLE